MTHLTKYSYPPYQYNIYYTSAYSKLFGGEKDVSTVIHYVDDSEFNTLCENNGIDYNTFYGDSLKCVLLNNLTHKQDTTKVFTTFTY